MAETTTLPPEAYIHELLTRLLGQVHPRLRTTFFQLSVPFWFNQPLVARLAGTSLENAAGIIERVASYSMVSALAERGSGAQAYVINSAERDSLQRLAIAEAPDLYRAAHLAALDYWQGEPEQNGFVQERMTMYHALFVDAQAGLDLLTRAYTGYVDDGQMAFAEQLVATAEDAFPYLRLLGQDATFMRELKGRIDLMYARNAVERRDWDEVLGILNAIEPELPPELLGYVTSLRGLVAAGDRREGPPRFGQAVEYFRDALAQIEAQPTRTQTEQLLKGQSYLAMGDAYVALAELVRGYQDPPDYDTGLFEYIRRLYYFVTNLPLVFYLSYVLGRRVWHPSFWPLLADLDWVVARLFVAGGRAYQDVIALTAALEPRVALRARERLASLFHTLGDAAEAERLLSELLRQVDEAEAAGRPFSNYEEARLRLRLGQARLWLGQAEAAFAEAQRAYPVFQLYEDVARAAQAQELAGDAVLARKQPDVLEAGRRYRGALELYARQGDAIAATAVDAKLWRLPAGAVTGRPYPTFVERHYPVPYRHPLTVLFQRLTVVLLLSLTFILPILTIHLDNRQTLQPDIDFQVSPLLDPTQSFVPQLSQGVTNVLLAPLAEPSLLLWLTFLLLAIFALLSSAVGVLLLLRTHPTRIQVRSDRALVRLGAGYLRVGVGESGPLLALDSVQRYIRSDIRVASKVNGDSSATVLEGARGAIEISGQTAHYDVLQARLATLIPAGAARIHAGYTLLLSKMGILLILSLVWITLLAGLAFFFPAALGLRLPLLGYSLADLQPLFFLTLYVPPLWWFIIQPLRLQRIRRRGNTLPYLIAFGGIGLTVLLLLTGFNFPLTVPDIYPLLTAIILSALGAYTLWRFRLAHDLGRVGQLLGLRPVRVLVGTAAVTAALLMLAFLVRELGVYHLRVQAEAARDKAVQLGQVTEVEPETMLSNAQRTELERAVWQYSQAISWSMAPLPYLNSPQLVADVYVNRAIARMSIGTALEPERSYLTPTLELDQGQYEAAFADFQRAIDLEPARAEFYLWRGFAQHSLGASRYAAALADYEAAVKLGSLTPEQAVKAYTGVGWIYYSSEEPEAARDAFLAAVATTVEAGVSAESRSDALLGLGYSYYALGEYEKAREAWESAQAPEVTDPMIFVSLGTLHWRLGTLDPNGVGRDLCRTQSIPETWQRAAALELWQAINYLNQAAAIPGQDPASLAFTYRTRAQVEYLLSPCPGEDELALIEASIASYGAALEFDPENATYWQMRGRIRYAAWSASPAGTGPTARVFLFDGIEDLLRAIAIRPDDDSSYQPNRWLTILSAEAIDGSIRQGEARLRADAYTEALAYFNLVATRVPDNSQAAFLAGLTALYLEDEVAARAWYTDGLARAASAATGRTQIEIALKQLSGAQVPSSMRPVQIELVTQLRAALSQ